MVVIEGRGLTGPRTARSVTSRAFSMGANLGSSGGVLSSVERSAIVTAVQLSCGARQVLWRGAVRLGEASEPSERGVRGVDGGV